MYKILIADDEQLVRQALKHVIEQNMPLLEVMAEARNGDEALALALEQSPDIILLDIKMPGKNGLEAAREIMHSNPGTRIIVVTAFDYFEYAQKALQIGIYDYLLKPVRPNELLSVLDKCVKAIEGTHQADQENKVIKEQLAQIWSHMESSFIYDLLNGTIIDEKDLKKRANDLGIKLLPAVVMVIAIETPDKTKPLTASQQKNIRQKVFEVLKESFNDRSSLLITPIMGEKFVLLIPCMGVSSIGVRDRTCRPKGEQIIRELGKFDISVSIGIGECYQDISMIRQSYLEAMVSQRCSSFSGGNKVVSCLTCKENNWIKQLREDQHLKEAELIDLICTGDWERTKEVLDFLWNTIRSSNLGEELQKACVIELLVVLYRSLNRSGKTQQMTVLNISNAEKLLSSSTINELGDSFYEAVKEIMELVQARKEEAPGSLIPIVKSFINNNFSKEITLEDAARYVHISPCYLSRIFSKEVGIPFKKYLSDVKIDYARHLLRSTHKTINEVAFEAGYRDASYFCRVFKQNEGIPPSEYRNSHPGFVINTRRGCTPAEQSQQH